MRLLDKDLDWVDTKLRHRHFAFGVVAAVVSFLLHAILIARFPNINFATIVQVAMDRYRQPVRVETVQPEPAPAAARPDRFRAQNPNVTADLPGEAMAEKRAVDELAIQPRMLPDQILAGENRVIGRPSAKLARTDWDPRLDILKLAEKSKADSVTVRPRSFTWDIPRGGRAADIVAPADRAALDGALRGDSADFHRIGSPTGKVTSVVLGGTPGGGGSQQAPPEVPPASNEVARVVVEKPETVTGALPLERLLKAEVQTYSTVKDLRYIYCRIEIKRLGPEILPVLPKDFALVQDCSASMTEQKLHFCREGLIRCLGRVGPEDRFNVFRFRDSAERCFPDWVKASAANVEQARRFIDDMRSEGNTDIYDSIRGLLSLPRTPGRPVIAMIASDGIPTVGQTDDSRIIAEFSRDNAGAVSVFTYGTISGANAYLLDLLSYCNRGDSQIETRGRWEIPDSLAARAEQVARPVLMDLQFRFARAGGIEAYPTLTSNLYLDRPLVIFCRCPRGTRRLVFQAVGAAGTKKCDMVFDVNLDRAPAGKPQIREDWAWQKVYQSIADYTRTKDPGAIREIQATTRTYGLELPFGIEALQ